jgi:hypothetical protein
MDKERQEITWTASEYHFYRKGAGWYLLSLLAAIILFLIALWQKNLFFAIFVVIAEIVLIYWAKRLPQTLDFKINTKGVEIGDIKFYPYEELHGFCIQEITDSTESPGSAELILKTKTKIHPFVKINIPKKYAETAKNFLKKFVKEIEYEDSVSDIIDRLIRF